MSKKMLIDASHSEETRVVVVDGSKVEDFDFEAAAKRPLRGNIYLAKVTRVEPSLQAAFVEYGGNRHGFLAFNEIHPDYYQIPFEDREALAAEEASAAAAEEAEDEAEAESKTVAESADDTDATTADVEAEDDNAAAQETDEAEADNDADADDVETVSEDDSDDDDEIDDAKAARRRRQLYRRYKIQEVIKRRQVLLVQVAKEERGNKGAALTTYLSLAGRYCVLMPNTPRGGGISRKISNAADRKRLKSVVNELDLPSGVGLIIRTAGAKRTKIEIRRDADYLLRLWSNIRELTLQSVAPSLIYEEGNLVKRAIRDIYDKDIDSVQVEGDAAYREAKDFMKLLMPSHSKKVQHYKEKVPLFLRYQVESQLEQIYSPIAPLKSGGYLVINPTEALVSIDVNSGRSTRERNIEATALKTNLEAAAEAARQMRLRDLAGLIVIDFIDMDESKNNRAVEKRMKDVLKRDRARLQMGRISQFGLMEISRQRRRTSILEGSTITCPTCGGLGHVRSPESAALVALRGLETEGMRGRYKHCRISVPADVALYILNEKREHMLSIEERFQMRVFVSAGEDLLAPDFKIEALETREPGEEIAIAPLSVESIEDVPAVEPDEEIADEEEKSEGTGRRRRRRRRRKSSGGDDTRSSDVETSGESTEEDGESAASSEDDGENEGGTRRRRRRGRRGGRGRRRSESTSTEIGEEVKADEDAAETSEAVETAPETESEDAPADAVEAPAEEAKPKRRRSRRRKSAAPEAAESTDTATDEASAADDAPAEAPEAAAEDTAKAEDAEAAAEDTAKAEDEKPKRRTRRPRKKKTDAADTAPVTEDKTEDKAEAETVEAAPVEEKPKRRTRRKSTKTADKPAETKAEEPAAESATETAAAARSTEAEAASVEAEPATTEAEVAPDKPKRRGWWSRSGLFGN